MPIPHDATATILNKLGSVNLYNLKSYGRILGTTMINVDIAKTITNKINIGTL